jgi:hypothetical protein
MHRPCGLSTTVFLTALVALALLPASAGARQVPSTAPVSGCPTVPFQGSVTNGPWLWINRRQGRLGAPRITFAEMTLFIPGRDSYPEVQPFVPAVP